MSNTPIPNEGLDVIVNDDGGVSVSAAELARLGVRPGSHLRLVPEDRPVHERPGGRSAGKLAGAVSQEVIEDFIRGLDEAKAERRAAYGVDQ